MSLTRRSFVSLLTAALAPPVLAQQAKAEAKSKSAQAPGLPSVALPYEQLPVRTTQAGNQSRAIMKGKLATGEELEMHHTTLNPGSSPHPGGHAHGYGEMWFIREGTLEVTLNGKSTRLGPGSVAFASANDHHEVKNAGDTPANYFVVALGPGAFR
jgi:mannose-6-phosphate isomerase-like protein (cupin superfamily)